MNADELFDEKETNEDELQRQVSARRIDEGTAALLRKLTEEGAHKFRFRAKRRALPTTHRLVFDQE